MTKKNHIVQPKYVPYTGSLDDLEPIWRSTGLGVVNSTPPEPEQEKKRSTLRVVGETIGDTATALASGVGGLIKSGGDLYGVTSGNTDNHASELGQSIQEYWDDKQSDFLKEEKQKQQKEIDEADGFWDKASAAASTTLTNPALVIDTVARNAATMLPGMVAGRLVSGAKAASGLRAAVAQGTVSDATKAAIAAKAGQWGTNTAVGVGATLQGADVSGDVYRASMKKTDAQWAQNPEFVAAVEKSDGSPQAIQGIKHDLARKAAFWTLPAAAGISVLANKGIAGGDMLERALVGASAKEAIKDTTTAAGRAAAQKAAEGGFWPGGKAAGKAILGEGSQEFVEESGGSISGNYLKQKYVDPNQDLLEGSGEAGGRGFAGGVAMGSGAGLVHGYEAYKGDPEAAKANQLPVIGAQPPAAPPVNPANPLNAVQQAAQQPGSVLSRAAVAGNSATPPNTAPVASNVAGAPSNIAAAPSNVSAAPSNVAQTTATNTPPTQGAASPTPNAPADEFTQAWNEDEAVKRQDEREAAEKAAYEAGEWIDETYAEDQDTAYSYKLAARNDTENEYQIIPAGDGGFLLQKRKVQTVNTPPVAQTKQSNSATQTGNVQIPATSPVAVTDNIQPVTQGESNGIEASQTFQTEAQGQEAPTAEPVEQDDAPLTPEQIAANAEIDAALDAIFDGDNVGSTQTSNSIEGFDEPANGTIPAIEQESATEQASAQGETSAEQASNQDKQSSNDPVNEPHWKNANNLAGRLPASIGNDAKTGILRGHVRDLAKKVPDGTETAKALKKLADSIGIGQGDVPQIEFGAAENGTSTISATEETKAPESQLVQDFIDGKTDTPPSVDEVTAELEVKEKQTTVNVPQPVSEALENTLRKQKARITRLRNEAEKAGILNDNNSLKTKLDAIAKKDKAEAVLRKLRLEIFNAEDAAIAAIESGDIGAFGKFADLFPDAIPAIQSLIDTEQPSSTPSSQEMTLQEAPAKGLDEQLAEVNAELFNQGRVQNASTRAKLDAIRKQIAERDFPEILKAVDDNIDVAEELNLAFKFAGDEPKAKTIERILKKRGITPEYQARWIERLMDGQNDELDAEMQSYEENFDPSLPSSVRAKKKNTSPSILDVGVASGRVKVVNVGDKPVKPEAKAEPKVEPQADPLDAKAKAAPAETPALEDGDDIANTAEKSNTETNVRNNGESNGYSSNDANDNQSLESQLQGASTEDGSSRNDETSGGLRQVDEGRDGNTDSSGNGRENGLDRDTESVLPSTPADIRPLADGPLGRKEDRPQQLTGDNPGNFVIEDSFDLGSGTDGQKISGNLNAIRTLRLVQNEQRYPTTDEQAIMARYVGWGGLAKVFDSSKADATDQYGKAQRELKTLLSPEEYAAANASIRNAHYTAQGVVDGMWRVIRFMGFKGGRALEPTVGIGNFIGRMPQDMAGSTEWHASELDKITGQLAAMVYPEANILAGTGFQDAPFADGVFDLSIGNPPFGAITIADKSPKRKHLDGQKIHNYIIAKTGMHLRPGGVMAMVVTHRFLDTANPEARDVLAKDFRFLGAFRLPNDAFLANAGTEVTTDVLFLQKLNENDARERDASWLDVNGVIVVDGQEMRVNRYFQEHPAHILGRSAMDGTMYGGRRDSNGQGEYTVHSDGRDLGEAIDALMQSGFKKMSNILAQTNESRELAPVMLQQSDLSIGGIHLNEDGKIIRREMDDEYGNAVINEITPDTLWKDKAAEWMALRNAIVDVKNAASSGLVTSEDANEVLALSRFLFKSDGSKAETTKAAEAVYELFEALSRPRLFQWTYDEQLNQINAALNRKQLGEDNYESLKGMLDLRNRVLRLIAAEQTNHPEMDAYRSNLNTAYDAFVKKHGFISDPNNANLLGGDIGAESGLESSFEPAVSAAVSKSQGIPQRKASATKADILSRRVNYPYKEIDYAENSFDALFASLSEHGKIDLPYMARITDKPVLEVIEDLTTGENPMLFLDPETETYQDAEQYLSGNVKKKLKEAQNRRLQQNVKALEAVLPKDLTKESIKPNIRGMWMPKEIFVEFLSDIGYKNVNITILESQGIIKSDAAGLKPTDFGSQFSNEYKQPHELFNAAAAGKAITITNDDGKKLDEATKAVNALAERMGTIFQDWAYADEGRVTKIVEAYNDKMNTHVQRTYDGVKYLRPVGASPSITLRRTQLNGAWRMMQEKTMLADHVVGAGKTFTLITGIMERRRMGLSRKPMVAVPNHLVTQWARDFYLMYPGAKILAATPADFAKKNRRRLLSRIATGDYDAVIVGHTSLGFIESNADDLKAIITEKVDALKQAEEELKRNGEKKSTLKQIQDKIEKYKERLKDIADRKTDDIGIDFKSLGVDYLAVDEAHEFKNLEYATSGERVVGMNDPNGSKKAFDLYVKVRGLLGRNGGIAFATGTPVSNSLVEIYTMMSYLAHDELKLRDQEHFDSWSGAYAATNTALEYTATQTLKPRRVLSGLNNLDALRQLYTHFADIITMNDIKRIYTEDAIAKNEKLGTNDRTDFPVPKVANGGRQLNMGDITPAQQEYMDYLVARMKKIESKKGDKEYMRIDNALNVLTDARKMSLDIRIVDPNAPRDESGKVARATKNIKRVYDKWEADRGTQLVFCDLSTPAKTAQKEAGKLINATIEAIYPKDQVRQVKKRLEGKKFEQQWQALVRAADEITDDITTSEEKRDALANYFAKIEDAEATMNVADIGFSVYDDLKAALVESGIPPTEIAFIHDFDTPEKKQKLFSRVNEGYIRVLIGSSAKMGAGTNAQKRLVALHHMDAPWRPSDVEQREGRIIRQGNQLYQRDPDGFEVEILAYSTNQTSDTVMWQILQRKAKAIEQFRNGGITSLEEESNDSDQYAEFMAASTGNPVFRQKLEAERKLLDLETQVSGALTIRAKISSFMNHYDSYKTRYENNDRLFEQMNLAEASYGGEKGTLDEYVAAINAAQNAYSDSLAAWEIAAEKAEADSKNWENAPPETRGKKPSFPIKPSRPNLLTPSVQEKSGYARAIGLALKEAKPETQSRISFEDGSRIVIYAHEFIDHSGGKSRSWEIRLRKNDAIDMLLLKSNATNLIDSDAKYKLLPENLQSEVSSARQSNQRSLKYLNEQHDNYSKLNSEKVDTSERDQAREEVNWLTLQVEFAEHQAAKERSERKNRYIARDTRRDLTTSSEVKDDPVEKLVIDDVSYTTTGRYSESYDKFSEATRDSDGMPVIIIQSREDGVYTPTKVFLQPKNLRTEPDASGEIRFSRNAGQSDIRMSRGKADEALSFSRTIETKATYEARIDALFDGERAAGPRQGVRVLDRSDILDMLGFGAKPLNLAEGKVGWSQDNHPHMTAAVWKKVPEWLENPAAVFDSDTVKGSLVFIAPETVNGSTVRMTVVPRPDGSADVSILTNAYDAQGFSPFARWFNSGLGKYVNKKIFPMVLEQSGLRLPSSAYQNQSGTLKILTEKNLVGYQKAHYSRGNFYYSALTKSVQGLQAKQMMAGAWEMQLKGLVKKGVIKQAELEWSGLSDWLKLQEGKITKEQILGYLGSDSLEASSMPLVNVREIVDVIRSTWKNSPDVVVASNMNDPIIPQAVRDADRLQKSQGAVGNAEGFVYDGKVYVVASEMNSQQDVVRVLFHEALGHMGLRGVFGKSLEQVLNQMIVGRRKDVLAKMRQYGIQGNTKEHFWEAAEEVLAEMAESTPELGFVQRAIAAIRNFLRANVPFFANLKLTDADIIQGFILPARRFVETGTGADYSSVMGPLFSASQESPRLAPNGKPSKLTESQWHQVRTPQFKAWFGDWEALQRQINHRSLIDKALDDNQWQKRTLLLEGVSADPSGKLSKVFGFNVERQYLTPDDVRKTFKRHGAGNEHRSDQIGLSRDDFVKALEILRDPQTYLVTTSNNGKPSAEFSRTFSDGTLVTAEVEIAEDGAIAVKSAWKKVPGRNHAGAKTYPIRTSDNTAGIESIVHSDSLLVNPSTVSKAVDPETGEPMVVYHGTHSDFDAFDPEYSVEGGFFFSANSTHASRFANGNGGNVIPAFTSLRNPFVYDGKMLPIQHSLDDIQNIIQQAKNEGYDGVLIRDFRDWDSDVVADTHIVFDPTQVKSATGNNGDFDGNNPDIRFSRTPLANANFSVGAQRNLQNSIVNRLNDLWRSSAKVSWWDKTVGTQYHLAERNSEYKRVFNAVQNFLSDTSIFANKAADLAPQMLPKLDKLKDFVKQALPASDVKAVSNAVFGGTLHWSRDAKGNLVEQSAVLEAAANMSVHDKADALMRDKKISPNVLKMWQGLPIEQYESLINSKYENDMLRPGVVFTPAELKAQFGMTGELQQDGSYSGQIGLYQEFRKATNRSLTDLAVSEMVRMGGSDLYPISDMLMEHGNVRVASDQITQYLESFIKANPDREAELNDTIDKVQALADRALDLMNRGYAPLMRFGKYAVYAKGANGEQLFFGMYETQREANWAETALRNHYPNAQISSGIMSQEQHKLFQGVSPETLALFGDAMGLDTDSEKAAIYQEFVKLVADSKSTMRRMLNRKGIPGYSEDATRVLAGFITSNSRKLASNLNNYEISKSVEEIKAGDVKDAAIKLKEYVQNPEEEAQWIRGALFTQYIGGSVASAMVNLTQSLTMTFPYLSQFTSVADAGARMAKAAAMAGSGKGIDDELQKALKRAEDDGVVAPQEIHQLMAHAQGKGGLKSGDGTSMGDAMAAGSNALSRLALAWGSMFSAAEVFNRTAAFIAAYQLAKDKNLGDPFAFAEKTVKETQGIYNKGNKPAWARGWVGSILFTFKQFTISYVEFLQRMYANNGRNGQEGKKAIALALGVLWLTAGISGMPGGDDLDDVIDAAAQAMGYNLSSDQWKQETVENVFGNKVAAQFFMHGLSGLPGVPIDVSGRMGLGNLIPGTGLFLRKDDHTRDGTEIFGPIFDFLKRSYNAGGEVFRGNIIDAAKEISPVAARNFFKGADMLETGMYRDDKGRKVIDTDTTDAISKMIGFQPSDVARVQNASFTTQRMVATARMVESEIVDEFAVGRFERDQSKIDAARKRLQRWNEKNPSTPIRITVQQVNKKVQNMNKTKAQRMTAAAPKEVRAAVQRELAGF